MIFLWSTFLVCVLIITICVYGLANSWFGTIPDLNQLQNPIDKFASQVFSEDGEMIGTWSYSKENRVHINYNAISPYVVDALVSTEDERFYEHSGIDMKALLRAIVKRGIMGHKSAGGGSTITQQLAKQLYSERASSSIERALQKPTEWVVAVKLERYYTKEEIITMYLNKFDFLHNAVGIKNASLVYFGKEPADLSLVEAATLVGMCKNPSYFNPVRNPERCLERRNVVLAQMYKNGKLTADELNEAQAQPLTLSFHKADHKDGIAPYLREYLRTIMMAKRPVRSEYMSWQMQKYYEDSLAWETDPLYGWCNKNRKSNGDYYNIYTDGLRIHTTLNADMQRYAEAAVAEHVAGYLQPAFNREKRGKRNRPYSSALSEKQIRDILEKSMKQSDRYRALKESGFDDDAIRQNFNTPIDMTVFSYHGDVDTIMTPMDSIRYYKQFLRAGFMAMDPVTGAVKAYVGGPNFAHFQYDMAMVGKRQVGSTIKPFLYSLAMQNGMTPCDVVPNVQTTYQVGNSTWTPRNGSRARYGEMVSLRWGLAQSNNWVSAYLINMLNPYAFVRLLRQYGIKDQSIHPSLSLCLGSCDISVGEMVSAYSAFANKGFRTSPLLVTRIEDSDGNVVATFTAPQTEVLTAESSYCMLDLLQGVINHGTGVRLRNRYKITAQMGGKTGTTNRNSDGWFMAVLPKLVVGTWVGGEDRDIHFDTMTYGQGASMALPVFALFIKKVYNNAKLGISPDDTFDIPSGFNPCGPYDGSSDDETSDSEAEEIVESVE